ncbi:hypothetical protein [Roseobacter ponti]|uniref:Uncharacterized protein n=1 Tax=Roseobacter ponti TaxID=1891787 RepID=A0A858SXZ2_9RHOB|nr:hypothetical protein [Roseobacter ponti]QJF51736.1 hypothetical protein G3256_11460 [Roseobacter ponti]
MKNDGEAARLDSVLSALGSIDLSHIRQTRVIRATAGVTLEDALCNEVSETILRRTLSFETKAGNLVLDAEERRINSIHSAKGGWANNGQDIVGRPLSRKDGAELMNMLNAFTAAADQVEVIAGLPKSPKGSSTEGVPVDDLRRTDRLCLNSGFDACAGFAVASVIIRPGVAPVNTGQPDVIDKLRNVRDAADADGRVVFRAGGLADNLAVAVVRTEDLDGTFAFPAEHLDAVLDAFHRRP